MNESLKQLSILILLFYLPSCMSWKPAHYSDLQVTKEKDRGSDSYRITTPIGKKIEFKGSQYYLQDDQVILKLKDSQKTLEPTELSSLEKGYLSKAKIVGLALGGLAGFFAILGIVALASFAASDDE